MVQYLISNLFKDVYGITPSDYKVNALDPSEDDILGVGFFNCYYRADGLRIKHPEQLPKKNNLEKFDLLESDVKEWKVTNEVFSKQSKSNESSI